MVWLLWGERNNLLPGKKFCFKSDLIIAHALGLHKEFMDANSNGKPLKANRRRRWSPPPHGFFKLNTDGAIRQSAMVVREEVWEQ